MTVADLVDWVGKLGPTGVIGLLLWRLGLFFKPHVEALIPILFALIKGHISLMGALEATLGKQSTTLEKVSTTQDEHGEILKHVASRS